MSFKLLLASLLIVLGFTVKGESLFENDLPPKQSLTTLHIDFPKIYPSLKVKTFHSSVAESYIVLDLNTGETIVSKNSETAYPLASLTKLMTAYLATQKENPRRLLTVPPSVPLLPENLVKIKTGEKYELIDCLKALLVYSANDMAYLLALEEGGIAEFVESMNRAAKDLNLNSFIFVDPAGLSLQNQGSAKDIALLLALLLKKPFLREILSLQSIEIKEQTSQIIKSFRSTSVIFDKLTSEKLIANKTGFLPEAGYNYASVFELKDGRRLAIVLLKANPASKQGAAEAALKLLSSLESF